MRQPILLIFSLNLFSLLRCDNFPQMLGIECEERGQDGASDVKEVQEQTDKSVVCVDDCGGDHHGCCGLMAAFALATH
jgi:hypothetical protein